eukprot:GEZU01002190.1.p1 GENE.GEZU01002190.1~~GEZU01002190.1.p1  ORF type:complete len:432 (-),score=117.87 GEZU01002190.1:58-1221(-)
MVLGDSQYFQETNVAKLDIIKKNLDDNNVSAKLEGMKRLIAMISKGKDVSMLFPDVVKNIVSPSLEVKKLVYMFLIHYAETKQDEAIMVVNTFQKDLSSRNQFIRALALRVMSSIRVHLITQILTLAIKKAATDVSPYVRKAAAVAIPKVYALDRDQKEELTQIIAKLLEDHNTLVLGSAIFAFNEICPDNWELIHPHYRKLCRLLVDCDEWGQVLVINTMMRYARAHFLSPFVEHKGVKKTRFYSDDENSDEEQEEYIYNSFDLDSDHKLLLKSTFPLLKSRNSAVVLAVASLYFHVAPTSEFAKVIKSLLRISRGYRENQFIVLTNIATMAKTRPELFREHLKEFFVRSDDSPHCRELKIEILSLLANESNVSTVLKEFKVHGNN